MPVDVLKILFPAIVAFIVGILGTPVLTHFLYKHKMWKKKNVQGATGGGNATITAQLNGVEEKNTPRMGGIVVWGSTLLTTLAFAALASLVHSGVFTKLNFLSREQTWLPLFTLIMGALCGLIDDYLVCKEVAPGSYGGGGLSPKIRLAWVGLLGAIGAYWFYAKLGTTAIHLPFVGDVPLGLVFIPVFIAYVIGMYAGSVIDGIDGLAGGVFSSIFTAFSIIAFANGQINIAAFCAVIVGALSAYLWFNIPPARFFNGETGTMGLTITIVVVAFLIHAEVTALIITLPLIVTAGSSAAQILSKKLRGGKKILLVAPLHNHFRAIGWPAYKVTMRYWVISMMLAALGVIVQLAGVHFVAH